MFCEDLYRLGSIFPTAQSETENRIICCTNHPQIPFSVVMSNVIPDHAVGGRAGLRFSLYTYSEDGKERRDNIPRSTLDRFVIHFDDAKITREQIFHYVYAVLHHPDYRARYAENLKRELPRIPLRGTAEDFHAFAKAGRKLADLHIGYEAVKPYKLQRIENREAPVNWRVEAMKLSKDGRTVIYNDWLALDGIPPEAHEQRLGNRSALAWVIDQYRIERRLRRRGASRGCGSAVGKPPFLVILLPLR